MKFCPTLVPRCLSILRLYSKYTYSTFVNILGISFFRAKQSIPTNTATIPGEYKPQVTETTSKCGHDQKACMSFHYRSHPSDVNKNAIHVCLFVCYSSELKKNCFYSVIFSANKVNLTKFP